jgi:acyl-coenzyme A thioesterase PaaI-like protein
MSSAEDLARRLIELLREREDLRDQDFLIPPPVFTSMGGEFMEFEAQAMRLVARFPVREDYLNPYGLMQGGMVTAAVDNTLGPLGLLVAPPNVTRRLEIKFSHPATVGMTYIRVVAEVMSVDPPWLHLKATVRDPDGKLLARVRATHWILKDEGADIGAK